MDIIVCIKQIPEELRINRNTFTLMREGIKGIMNPSDKNAIELAVMLKEQLGGKVTLVSMGPSDVEKTLMHGLAMGADKAVLVCEKAFAGADSLATAFTLATAIKKLGNYQLVLCGKESADGGTQQVGPQIAGFLGIKQVTYAVELVIDGNRMRVKRKLQSEYETVELELPALVTIVKGINEPRIPTYSDIYDASQKSISTWCLEDLDLEIDQVGSAGSPTKISSVFIPEASRQCEMIKGSLEEISLHLKEILEVKGFI